MIQMLHRPESLMSKYVHAGVFRMWADIQTITFTPRMSNLAFKLGEIGHKLDKS